MSSQLQVSGEAKIRDIQGPVVANSGVITALDGAASQYVRGDGTLADFPTSTGGGSSVSYYLNSSVSQGTIGGVAYRELSKEPIIGAGTDIAISTTGYVASYLTDANDPDVILIPGGNFNCEFYFSVNNNSGNPFFYAELYKYDGTTFTLLGSSVGVPEYITQGTTIAPYYFAIPVATATLALTDRLAIRIYVNVSGRTITLHTENGHLCQVVTTLSKGMVSLNNLTDQSQFITTGTSGTNFAIVSSGDTHTFNLPVASASNTGKLSSSDWSVFNAKQAALSFTAPLVNTSNTISIPVATSLVDGYLDNLDWTNFNTAYNNMIVSAAVTGTTTKTLTLTQQDAGTITASWTDDNTDAVTSVFGRTGAVVAVSGDYNTSQVTENTNLYFTDGRARAALSFTAGSGAYNSTTGVITIPTNNNQITNGSNFITLTSLSGGTGISYNNTTGVITNSAPDQTVSLTAGAGISISGSYPSFIIASTITQYTDALARAALSFTAGSGAYNSTTGVITIPTNNNQITNGAGYITSSALSGYVPYTGATTNVNLGVYSLTANQLIAGGASTDNVATLTTYDQGHALKLKGSTGDLFFVPYFSPSIGARITAQNSAASANTPLSFYASNFFFNSNVNFGSTLGNGTYTYTLPSATGTLALTSNLSAYLPLTGGTLTGALSGTSATFSGTVEAPLFFANAGGSLFLQSASDAISIRQNSTSNNLTIRFNRSGVDLWKIQTVPNGANEDFKIFNSQNSTNSLTIASSGAATFSSSVTLSASDSRLLGGDSSGRIVVSNSNTSSYLTMNGASNATPYQVVLGVNSINALTLASTGAATFSSSVTSGDYIRLPLDTYLQSSDGSGGWIELIKGSGINTVVNNNKNGAIIFNQSSGGGEKMRITSGGIINTTSRLNVNGAGDNSLFSLINNGTTYTLGFSPNASASTSTTLTITTATTTWIYNGTGTATWTLPNPSGTNQMFWIKNAGTGVLTLNAFSGTNIINNSATAVSSITIAVGATALIQQDGNIRSYQLQ
jgi:hypothetical protein